MFDVRCLMDDGVFAEGHVSNPVIDSTTGEKNPLCHIVLNYQYWLFPMRTLSPFLDVVSTCFYAISTFFDIISTLILFDARYSQLIRSETTVH